MVKFNSDEMRAAMARRNNIRNISIIAHIDSGKCYTPDTLIPTYDGTIKAVKDLQIGDDLLGDHNNSVRITSIHKGSGKMYTITQKSGYSYTVNENHVLCLKATNVESVHWYENKGHYKARWLEKFAIKETFFPVVKQKMLSRCTYYETQEDAEKAAREHLAKQKTDNPLYVGYGDVIEISVSEYMKLEPSIQTMFKGYKCGFEFPHKDVLIEPYMLGYWLGDGTSEDTGITTADIEIVEYLQKFI